MLKKVDPGSGPGLTDQKYFCELNLEIGKGMNNSGEYSDL